MEDKIKQQIIDLQKAIEEKVNFMNQLKATYAQCEKEIERLMGAVEVCQMLLKNDESKTE